MIWKLKCSSQVDPAKLQQLKRAAHGGVSPSHTYFGAQWRWLTLWSTSSTVTSYRTLSLPSFYHDNHCHDHQDLNQAIILVNHNHDPHDVHHDLHHDHHDLHHDLHNDLHRDHPQVQESGPPPQANRGPATQIASASSLTLAQGGQIVSHISSKLGGDHIVSHISTIITRFGDGQILWDDQLIL